MKYFFRTSWIALLVSQCAFATIDREIELAITVDDLPSTSLEHTQTMTQAFHDHGVRGVYGFINGKRALNSVVADFSNAVLQHWVNSGHFLGNHTYSHSDLNSTDVAQFEQDNDANEPWLNFYSSNGQEFNFKYFRFPFLREGNTLKKRNAVREVLAKRGYSIAQVTVDFGDYLWSAPYKRCLKKKEIKSLEWLKKSYVDTAFKSLLGYAALAKAIFDRPIKHILLFHTSAINADATDLLIQKFKEAGVRFISLESALTDSAYTQNPNLPIGGGANFLDQMARARKVTYPKEPSIPAPPKKKLASICRD